jgi:hypothetical protein
MMEGGGGDGTINPTGEAHDDSVHEITRSMLETQLSLG